MIIPNGTIEFGVNSGGGFDENGYPIASTTAYGAPIPCQFRHTSLNRLAISNDEHYVQVRYTIWVEVYDGFPTERVRLKSRLGRQIGEFSVIGVTPLEAVCQYEILV